MVSKGGFIVGKDNKLMEVAINIKYNEPQHNMRVYSKEALEKAFDKAKERFGDKGVPVTVPYVSPSMVEYMTVKPEYVAGNITDIDMENGMANVTLQLDKNEYAKLINEAMANGTEFSLNPRVIVSKDGPRIISYDIVQK